MTVLNTIPNLFNEEEQGNFSSNVNNAIKYAESHGLEFKSSKTLKCGQVTLVFRK